MSFSRNNHSTRAVIDLSHIYASGTFKDVHRGIYQDGPRAGEECVSKEFKYGTVFEDHFFQEELAVTERAQQVIDAWNEASVVNRRIVLNRPTIWKYDLTGHKSLIEPMIYNFEKFNSNTGWVPRSRDAWRDAMQALSHFSYHRTFGQYLLCDLQGGMYSDGYILTDPAIMSHEGPGRYGPADLGPDGIRTFFSHHACTRFCSITWMRPRSAGPVTFPMRRGTSMTARPLMTRQSRTPLTRVGEEGMVN